MALVQNKYSFSYSPLVGDLSYSRQNRILLEIANFLTNNGFSLAYKYSAPTQNNSDIYTFYAIGNIYLYIYFYSSSLVISSGFGPLSASGGLNFESHTKQININSSGILNLDFVSSNNCKLLCINNQLVFSCFLFNKGWGNSSYYDSFFTLEVNSLFHYCSKLPFGTVFSMTDINNKHLLLNPIFTFNTVPKNMGYYKIDDSIIYMGECYEYPNSMGTLQEFVFYQSSDGTKYFNGGLLSKILIVD